MPNMRNDEYYADPTTFNALLNIEQENKEIYKYRPIVYICSPFAGDTKKNIAQTQKYCRFAVDNGYMPIAPHLLYPQFLNDKDYKERELGMFFGYIIMSKCQEVWVCGSYISPGMEAEIKRAEKKRYRIRYFNKNFREVKDDV